VCVWTRVRFLPWQKLFLPGQLEKNGGKMAKTPQFNKFIFDFVMFILVAASFLV